MKQKPHHSLILRKLDAILENTKSIKRDIEECKGGIKCRRREEKKQEKKEEGDVSG